MEQKASPIPESAGIAIFVIKAPTPPGTEQGLAKKDRSANF